ncbi:MAG: hypothetical protein LR000_00530 [Candidatus Pacebacteria bacterium]|nr:hypothetical protein [Candidatus Paceibacterota bacterium]
MKKQKRRELTIFFLVLVVLISFFPLFLSAQISPPEKEEVKNLTQRIATSTKPFFGFFEDFWSQKFVPFFLDSGEKIKIWWQKKAKFEIINWGKRVILFFEKEVVIE